MNMFKSTKLAALVGIGMLLSVTSGAVGPSITRRRLAKEYTNQEVEDLLTQLPGLSSVTSRRRLAGRRRLVHSLRGSGPTPGGPSPTPRGEPKTPKEAQVTDLGAKLGIDFNAAIKNESEFNTSQNKKFMWTLKKDRQFRYDAQTKYWWYYPQGSSDQYYYRRKTDGRDGGWQLVQQRKAPAATQSSGTKTQTRVQSGPVRQAPAARGSVKERMNGAVNSNIIAHLGSTVGIKSFDAKNFKYDAANWNVVIKDWNNTNSSIKNYAVLKHKTSGLTCNMPKKIDEVATNGEYLVPVESREGHFFRFNIKQNVWMYAEDGAQHWLMYKNGKWQRHQ